MASDVELAAAENKVRAGEEAIARVRRELDSTVTPETKLELKRLEEEQERLIEYRNALFREVAGNDY